MSEANKTVVRRWQEAYNTGELDILDEVLAPTWATNGWPAGMPQSVAVAKEVGRGMLALLPDLHYEIVDLMAEGDRVAMRYVATATHSAELFGFAPTGRLLEWGGINMFQVVDGKIVGHWAFVNELTTLEQCGAEFPPEWEVAKHRNAQDEAVADLESVES